MTALQLSDVNALIVSVTRLAKRIEQLHATEPERAAVVSKSFARAVKAATQKLKAIEVPAELPRPLRPVVRREQFGRDYVNRVKGN
jgi:hypothetical protein